MPDIEETLEVKIRALGDALEGMAEAQYEDLDGSGNEDYADGLWFAAASIDRVLTKYLHPEDDIWDEPDLFEGMDYEPEDDEEDY